MLTNRQQQCLRGIGIHRWHERATAPGRGPEEEPSPASIETQLVQQDNAAIVPATAMLEPESAASSPLSAADSSSPAQDESITSMDRPPLVLDSWSGITAAIQGCEACELSKSCIQKVPGTGDHKAQLLIVGEGPGHDEDVLGEPFVGRSGQLLERMLATIGIAREQVFITNIVKCRPPNNRDPKQEEARLCRVFLEAQIEKIAPRIILAVGRVSAHNLLGSSEPVGKLIQQMHQLPGTDIPVKVTYHPAYLLRHPSAKAIAWQDLKLLHQLLQ